MKEERLPFGIGIDGYDGIYRFRHEEVARRALNLLPAFTRGTGCGPHALRS